MLLTTAGSALAVVLKVLLVLAGIDMLVTGAAGHCPLYQRLGHTRGASGAPDTDHHGTPDDDATNHSANRADTLAPPNGASHRHGGHGLIMIACCIPMLVIAAVLVATRVVSMGVVSQSEFPQRKSGSGQLRPA